MQDKDKESVKKLEVVEHSYDHRLSESDIHHSAGDTHGTEMGWLVSYADMMTLLFGLFVLLYVMASEKNGNIEENMKEVSEKYFSETKTDKKIKSVAKESPEVIKIKKLQGEIAALKQIPDQREVVTQLQGEVAALKLIPDQREVVVQLKSEIEQLKKVPEVTVTPVEKIPDQRELVAELKKEIEILKKYQNTDQSQLIAELKKKLEELMKKNNELTKRDIASTEAKFMMISAIWTTEKHDIDLVVTDPNGFKYNFKNKRGPSSIGSFEIDSRYGPGLELWKTEDLKPGKYQVQVSLYNQYGNLKDADVKISIVTNKKNQYLKPAKLSMAHKIQKYEFTVDEKGNISE